MVSPGAKGVVINIFYLALRIDEVLRGFLTAVATYCNVTFVIDNIWA